jgi:hypothetical protein
MTHGRYVSLPRGDLALFPIVSSRQQNWLGLFNRAYRFEEVGK